MQANFYSCWLTMKYAIPHMIRSGGGAIVNTGSSLAYRGWKEVPAYVSSKHALLGLTRSVAIEHAANNIRVNLLCPSSMDTPMLAPVATSTGGGDTELGYQRLRDMIPSGRIAPPPEVANVAEYLLLDAPRHLSGIILPVDAAETAG
jgi:NAD(P)-dependent dehydrogenase (short-subunit alcohol dehydrogenase family)